MPRRCRSGVKVRLRSGLRAELLEHARQAEPIEACGLLGGDASGLSYYRPCRNARQSPMLYAIAPEEVLEALRLFAAQRVELMGVFHAHPLGEPYPSAVDVAEAAYPGLLHVIAAPGRAAGLRGFWIADGVVVEEPLEDDLPALEHPRKACTG